MANNITFAALIAQTFILFLANYFFIKAARFVSDTVVRLGRLETPGADEDEVEKERDLSPKGHKLKVGGAATAFVFGATGKEKNEQRRFQDWKPIRYQAAIISTSTIIIYFTIILSSSFSEWLKIPPIVASPLGGICPLEDSAAKIANLKTELARETNVQQAREQHARTDTFLKALQNDTSLYGSPGHTCTVIATHVRKQSFWNHLGSVGRTAYASSLATAKQPKRRLF